MRIIKPKRTFSKGPHTCALAIQAYLVLEYASKGDLHSHIVATGSLDEASTRFVVGEVVAALAYVHAQGTGMDHTLRCLDVRTRACKHQCV